MGWKGAEIPQAPVSSSSNHKGRCFLLGKQEVCKGLRVGLGNIIWVLGGEPEDLKPSAYPVKAEAMNGILERHLQIIWGCCRDREITGGVNQWAFSSIFQRQKRWK